MAPVNDLVNLAQVGQSLALVGHNVGVLKKKKIDTKDIVKLGVTNIIGVGLIKATGNVAGGL